jgi:CheY-like chemotaxis protein
VLVVEDDNVSRHYLTAGLQRLGHEVRQAQDGALAIATLREEEFDCVEPTLNDAAV